MRFLKILSSMLAAVMFMLTAVSGLCYADDFVITDEVIDPETGLMFTLLEDDTYSISCPESNHKMLTGELVIPSEYNGRSVTSIAVVAFWDCNGLTSVTIPQSVTNIGEGAFLDCNNLTSILIPQNVTSIGGGAFSSCTSLTAINVDENNEYYCSDEGVLFNKNKTELISYPNAKKIETYVVPESVTKIGDGAFYGHDELVSIDLHEGITTIGLQAFSDCKKLISLTIPKSVTDIGLNSFVRCESLTSIVIPDGIASIEEHTFNGCKNLTSVTLPKTVTLISDYAFWGCEKLTSIDLHEGITTIGRRAFGLCKQLASLVIPESVTNIDELAFWGCESLTSVNIPKGVSKVPCGLFIECSGLKSVAIPASVEKIEGDAFSGTSIKDVYYDGAESQWRKIEIEDGNAVLASATIHYGGTDPDDTDPNKPDTNEPTTSEPVTSDPTESDTSEPTTNKPDTGDSDDTRKPDTSEPSSGNMGGTDKPSVPNKPSSPSSSDKGQISKDVQTSENAPKTEIMTPNGTLMEAVLTVDEQGQLKNGIDIDVVLKVNEANSAVSDTDRAITEETMHKAGYSLGIYLDLKLFKTIGGEELQINETNAPITVSFEIPLSLRSAGRKYAVIRVHNGKADILNDYDNDENTVTIRTDKFSTYVLAYSEKSGGASITQPDNNLGGVPGSTGGNPNTGGNSHAIFYFIAGIISLFVFIILCLFTGKNGMTEEEKECKFAKLIAWGKNGGKIRAVIALTVIFLLLSFYYGIGMKKSAK